MQTIYLDISNKGVVPTVYAKQNDVGRKFAVILTDSGLPYIPADGSAFSVWYKGASGEGNYTDIGDKSAFSLNGNKVEVEMIVQMLSAHGDGILCLTLNSKDGSQISSWNIPYICEFVPGAESEKAEEYYTAFSKAVEELPYPDESLSIKGRAADSASAGAAIKKAAPHNLLDNSDFRNPVNQRGIASGAVIANAYCIDRWKLMNVGQLAFNDGYITISANQGYPVYFRQYFKKLPKFPATVRLEATSGIITATFASTGRFTFDDDMYVEIASDKLVDLYIPQGKSISIVNIALYEGEYTAETLPEYHPKGYGAELAECRRYYRHDCLRGISGYVMPSGQQFIGLIPDCEMRTAPTLTLTNMDSVIIEGDAVSVVGTNGATRSGDGYQILLVLEKQMEKFDVAVTANVQGNLSADL